MEANEASEDSQGTSASSTSSHVRALAATIMDDSDAEAQSMAVVSLRRVLAVMNPPIRETLDSGVLPKLLELLRRPTDSLSGASSLHFEVAWVLTNLTTAGHQETVEMVEAGTLEAVIPLLAPANDVSLKEQAIWTMGNIAGDAPDLRDKVLALNGLDKITQAIAGNSSASLMRVGAWAISNLLRGKPAPAITSMYQALPIVASLLQSSDFEVKMDACWAFSYITDVGNEALCDKIFHDHGWVVPTFIDLLSHSQPSLVTPALRALGNIANGNDNQTQFLVDNGLLPKLRDLLSHYKRGIVKEACWAISNIAAGTMPQVDALISNEVLSEVFRVCKQSDAHPDIKKEALWAVSNATLSANPKHFDFLVANGILDLMVEALDSPPLRQLALEALENILNTEKSRIASANHNVVEQAIAEIGALATVASSASSSAVASSSPVTAQQTTENKVSNSDGTEEAQSEEQNENSKEVQPKEKETGRSEQKRENIQEAQDIKAKDESHEEIHTSKRAKVYKDGKPDEEVGQCMMKLLSGPGLEKMLQLRDQLELEIEEDNVALENMEENDDASNENLRHTNTSPNVSSSSSLPPDSSPSSSSSSSSAVSTSHTNQDSNQAEPLVPILVEKPAVASLQTKKQELIHKERIFNLLNNILGQHFGEYRRYTPSSLLLLCAGFISQNKALLCLSDGEVGDLFGVLPAEVQDLIQNGRKPKRAKRSFA